MQAYLRKDTGKVQGWNGKQRFEMTLGIDICWLGIAILI